MPYYDDYHRYGLVRVSATRYEKCHGECCKSGRSVNWARYYGEEEEG